MGAYFKAATKEKFPANKPCHETEVTQYNIKLDYINIKLKGGLFE